jgi:GDPmannose 4,6-dehydratase
LNTSRVDHLYQDAHESSARLLIHYADMADGPSLTRLLGDIAPDEVYNLAAMSHVRVSFEVPENTADITGVGALRLLEATWRAVPHCRFYQASSSEMFGAAPPPQSELTPFHPRSPYACAKLFAHVITVNYREAYQMHASSGILFNHESPRRGETFVTRKVTQAVARIKLGLQDKLYLGNLNARRDWGFAPDYVRAMWMMLQQDEPDDYVIGTGESHTVREFVEKAFAHAGLDWRDYVVLDPRYERPSEVDHLLADTTKASQRLGWEPEVRFDDLVRIMVDADMVEASRALPLGTPAMVAHTT